MKRKLSEIWRDFLEQHWNERYIPPQNDPHSHLVFILGEMRKPPLRLAVEILVNFWVDHWKWIIATTIAIAGLIGHLMKA